MNTNMGKIAYLVIGLFAGANLGLLMFALLTAGRRADETTDRKTEEKD